MGRARTRRLLAVDDGGPVTRTVLPSGLRVVSHRVPGAHSVSVGVWVALGSVDESPTLGGVTHFLEHLVFKGTHGRDGRQISAALDEVGGELNAFTGKEFTCYYSRVLTRDLPVALDVLADMMCSARLAGADVEIERGVIADEIAMGEDELGDLVHDLFAAQFWPDSAHGRPITGTPETLDGLSRERIAGWYRRRYTLPRMVVSVAGDVAHADVTALARRAFAAHRDADTEAEPQAIRDARSVLQATGGLAVHTRDSEQAHLVVGMPGLTRNDPRRYAAGVLHAAVGGGMSSRLFTEVREKRGLAYTVGTFGTAMCGTGVVGAYAGSLPGKAPEVLGVVRDELATVARTGISAAEVERGRGQLRGSILMGLEDAGAKMTRIAKAELVYDELPPTEQIVARVDAVTTDEVNELAAELYTSDPAVTVVGPFDSPAAFR